MEKTKIAALVSAGVICVHCKAHFHPTESQARHLIYRGSQPVCSKACMLAVKWGASYRPTQENGPCPSCGKMFYAKNQEKKFCNLTCYSRHLADTSTLKCRGQKGAAAVAAKAASVRAADPSTCMHCGRPLSESYRHLRKLKAAKFCNQSCYRSFMAERFDRWLANPETLALPQCYDEFLDREVLTCPIRGCTWSGQWLSAHVNRAHGFPAPDFKRAAGFCKGSAIITPSLAKTLRSRERSEAQDAVVQRLKDGFGGSTPGGYRALEAIEHVRKSRLTLRDTEQGPLLICEGCDTEFVATWGTRPKYCSVECRTSTYHARHKVPAPELTCRECGRSFTRNPSGRHQIYCTVKCRDAAYSRKVQ
jgi:hypothetical protein